jgi:hypothetical protein
MLSVVSTILNNLKSTGGASLIRSGGHDPLEFRYFSSGLLIGQTNMKKYIKLLYLMTYFLYWSHLQYALCSISALGFALAIMVVY